jgi:hypothetical protein
LARQKDAAIKHDAALEAGWKLEETEGMKLKFKLLIA